MQQAGDLVDDDVVHEVRQVQPVGGPRLQRTAVDHDPRHGRAAVVVHPCREQALCAQTDPEAFFPEKGGSTREAKRICVGCEVKGECLEYALGSDERFGIWGGLSERERRRLKRAAS